MLRNVKSADLAGSDRTFDPLSLFANTLFIAAVILALALTPGTGQADQRIDITDQVSVDFEPVKGKWKKKKYDATVVVTNTSAADITGPLRIVITEFKNKRHLLGSADGVDDDGYSYFEVEVPGAVLEVGASTDQLPVVFKKMSRKAWKKWKKASKSAGAKDDISDPPGWSDHDFPIKFNFLVSTNFNNPDAPPKLLSLSEPDAAPGSLRTNSGRVDVRVTVSALTNSDFPIESIFLKRRSFGPGTNPLPDPDPDCDYYDPYCCSDNNCSLVEVNDSGFLGDLAARDGIYTATETFETDEIEPGTCFNYVAVGTYDNGIKVESDPSLLCASKFFNELVETEPNEFNVIQLGEASVMGNELLVRMEPGARTDAFEKILTTVRGIIVGSQIEDGIYQVAFDRPFPAEQLQQLIDLLGEQAGVIRIDPNYVGSFTSIPSDPEFENQHGMRLVSADSLGNEDPRYVWDAGATGAGVDVILLDSGVNELLPDDINPKAEFDKDKDDQLGHGTEMGAIIAAPTDNETAIAAMARDARIRSVRVSKSNNVTLTKMLKGFKRAKGYAGRNTVVSASFSIRNMLSDGGVCRQINKIINRGAIVVVSAGNDDSNADTGIVPGNCNSPAFDPFTDPGPVSSSNKNSLIVVGATNCTDGACETEERWPGSNRGSWVDIGAPGVNIPTTTNNGNVVLSTGTSPAAALVAGAAAILRSCDVGGPVAASTLDLTLDDVFNAMDLGAFTPVSGLPSRLNVYNALASVNTPPGTLGLTEDTLVTGTDTTGGLAFATVTFVDTTVCDAHSIEVTGGEDFGVFSIGGDNGDQLVIEDGVLDFADQSVYEVEITVNDFYGGSSTQLFTIDILD